MHQKSDQQAVNNFKNNFEAALPVFKYEAMKPKMLEVYSRNSEDWINTIKKTIGQVKVQLIVLIIPGPKGKNTIYNDLKKTFTCDFPVPCQCIISGTLMKGKLHNQKILDIYLFNLVITIKLIKIFTKKTSFFTIEEKKSIKIF